MNPTDNTPSTPTPAPTSWYGIIPGPLTLGAVKREEGYLLEVTLNRCDSWSAGLVDVTGNGPRNLTPSFRGEHPQDALEAHLTTAR